MLSFVQSFFTPKASPIGIDFGSESLRMAQVRRVGKDLRLIAAASADVPSHVRNDPAGRLEFFSSSVRELLAQNEFVGRQAVIALPAASMYIQHLRIAKMDEEARRKAIPWEARGKLPIDPSQAILRHHVAGEIYQDQEPREEIVLMAAGKELVNQLLSAASRARLDVVGMEVEAKALLDCFAHVYRRKSDAEATFCFVDIGTSATRAVVARGGHILFARSIPIGGDHFNQATSAALNIPLEEARLVRLRIAATVENVKETKCEEPAREQIAEATIDNSFALLKASVPVEAERRSTGPSDPQLAIVPAVQPTVDPQSHLVEAALREPLTRLVQELDLCRRYYEATFPSHPIDRLVFVGGEAHHRRVCQRIAMELSLSAQVGDPMVRLAGTCDLSLESTLDPTVPQPSWAVALGLSMGATVNTAQRAVKS
ncbi:MAG TPA: pilus assembly protein PilM [Tepidisphaeraceae bacterium]|jgi:type IV pilus assembly protein PilM|nr:pilus assembly protein PilM [Tepidisphaeraceae bacterium]